jgi:hypothetical protein
MTLPQMIGMDGDLLDESSGRPLGADQDADRVGSREGDHAAADQTCRSRIDRLNATGVIAGSSGKYGDQQRFSASTSSAMSSVRQKRYADMVSAYVRAKFATANFGEISPGEAPPTAI